MTDVYYSANCLKVHQSQKSPKLCVTNPSSACSVENVELKNLPFGPGNDLLIKGTPNANAKCFSVNVGHSDSEVGLHISVRFDAEGEVNTIVLNSKQGDVWKDEQRAASFPFKEGKEFQMTITNGSSEFLVNLHDGQIIHFPNRLANKTYEYVFVRGDVKVDRLQVN
ncbi:galactose-binding lectin l-1-like isoform X1 [Anguilla anguilla]|uniref:Galectin n=1 Tax=Anguilla anguilla TaxID=7936 RepID=A0A9D3MS26_ANGAN|nr:galactose-binding lectin l-1-like isoform X1 [Anguilla anguilla]KAG5853996.1 hypothetical protein ANANG_G00032780 [Anguilla anguilla]